MPLYTPDYDRCDECDRRFPVDALYDGLCVSCEEWLSRDD